MIQARVNKHVNTLKPIRDYNEIKETFGIVCKYF